MDRKHDHDEDAEAAPVRGGHGAVEAHDEKRQIDAGDDHRIEDDEWEVTPEDRYDVGGDTVAARGAAGNSGIRHGGPKLGKGCA